ncbi:DUF805 domain-containing protein [Leclercia adecarboxylata]|uniref:DUF805 domain-containing protein n=1 Tax=Leclercia adecarboxylata TaxID=83655 RepID=A0AAP9AGB3_9ENTR|nr:DUF805 domain-containing protein [Leclercia adecarboxylata]QDK16993.1 DUF805 domain-containing protein [Leclercia adecarboxylata]
MNKSIKDGYYDGWKKTFVYKGRTTRKAFWSFIVMNIMIVLFIAALSYFLLVVSVADSTSWGGMMLVWAWYVWLPLSTLAPIILLVPVVSLGIRRLHDAGKSGWWFGGALLMNLLILPLILTGIHQVMLILVEVNHTDQAMKIISITLSTLAALYLLWLCCLPSKPAAENAG